MEANRNQTADGDDAIERPVYFRPLIPLLLAFLAGILASRLAPVETMPLEWAGILFSGIFCCLMVLLAAARSQRPLRFSPLALFFFLGLLSLFPWTSPPLSPDHIRHAADDGKFRRISGVIAEPPVAQSFRTVCILENIRISGPEASLTPRPVRGRLRVLVYGAGKTLHAGDRIIFASKIKAFTNFNNFGGFDYKRFMAFQNVWGNAYTSAAKISVTPRPEKGLESLREAVSRAIRHAATGDAGAVLHALILGDRRDITPELREAFNRAGISHLLAISGLHVGIVASVSFFLFRWLLSWVPFFLVRAWTRKGAALLAMGPVLAYGVLAGMSPSTQRAVIMVCVFLLTFLVERDHDLPNTLCIAALTILILHPPSVFSVAFQLSFASVIFIIFGMRRMPGQRENPMGVTRRFRKILFSFTAVSFLAIVGTAPLTLFHFNQISVAGLLSNLIFIPLIGFVVVPLSLFSVLLLLPLWTLAAQGGLMAAGAILSACVKPVHFIAALPFASAKTISPSVLEMVCFYGICVCGYVLAASRIREKHHGHSRLASGFPENLRGAEAPNASLSLKPVLLLLAVFGIILGADAAWWVHKRWWGKAMTVTVLDVGQGNAALVELPRGRCVLIDGGGYTDNLIFDVGEKVVAPFLWRNKIRTIDTVFLTHYDADHLNGLIYILNHFGVQTVYATHDPETALKNRGFLAAIQKHEIAYPLYGEFPETLPTTSAVFHVLYPPRDFADRAKREPWRNSNNNSMVVRVVYGEHGLLFPGDIMAAAEKELAAESADLRATILLAPHHGSGTSSTAAFLDRIRPELVVISCGNANRFGFPAEETLARYAERGLRVLRTDIHGAVSLKTDGRRLRVRTSSGEEIAF